MTAGDDVIDMPGAPLVGSPARSLLSLVSVGVLSYRALQTVARSLENHRRSGLVDAAGEFFVFFNGMTAEDKKLAEEAGISYFGSAKNTGIYGGFRAIAEKARNPYVLILENDIVSLAGSSVLDCIESCLSDMIEHNIKCFCLRSREQPGAGGTYAKYVQCFGVEDPFLPTVKPQKAKLSSRIVMFFKHGGFDKFRARSMYIERYPERVERNAVRKLSSGNYVTDSRYRNWSNQAVLVERQYFLDVICRRVEEHPDPRLVNGHQDIERALNVRWWRRRRDLAGQAGIGVFTHARLD
jgi:hypothetical protein